MEVIVVKVLSNLHYYKIDFSFLLSSFTSKKVNIDAVSNTILQHNRVCVQFSTQQVNWASDSWPDIFTGKSSQ